MVVVGLFARDSDAEIALNNLDEAEFPARSISLLASDPARAAVLTLVKGPWSGVAPAALATRLQRAGMAREDCQAFIARIDGGAAGIAVRVSRDTAAVAAEILTDQKADAVQTLIRSKEQG